MNGRLFVHASARAGKTILQESFFTPPFKLADVTENKNGRALHLMIMSSSPGLLDGDRYEISVKLEEQAAVVLTTQSFQRLFKMQKGASQMTEICLQRGASLIYLPQPSVPHESAIFHSENLVRMEAGSSLIFGEVVTCGRILNGERFAFSRYDSLTRIYCENKLIIKENLRLSPGVTPLSATGLLEGFSHQASMVCLADGLHIESYMAEARAFLDGQTGIDYGITAAQKTGITVRILGNAAYQLHELLQVVARLSKIV